ncbi:MAG: thiamine pyrophosphate-dependent enzyme [Eubacteriales bacterium]|jgi:pyruvate ferredoxin oxidoreductase beta subunit|nr:thiamine pyrophosphate-dependent enzyme [Eubacteriales bacterium]
MIKLQDITEEELLYGSLACAGCGGIIALRMALKVLGKNTVLVLPAGCLMATCGFFPQMAVNVPLVSTAFPSTPSTVSGLVAGLKVKGKEDITVLGVAGDGGTADIGLQALSGSVERGENFVYICYDNEAYMNTGGQRSSETPYGAWTTTTPVGRNKMWEDKPKKDLLRILAAHNIPYAARTSISHPREYMDSVRKAKETKGPAVIHVLAPCPSGWGTDTSKTVELARLAVETGIWEMAEYENGKYKVTKIIKNRKPVKEYIKAQGRYRHLPDEEIEKMQKQVDEYWKAMS